MTKTIQQQLDKEIQKLNHENNKLWRKIDELEGRIELNSDRQDKIQIDFHKHLNGNL